jgi:hypothetical protein
MPPNHVGDGLRQVRGRLDESNEPLRGLVASPKDGDIDQRGKHPHQLPDVRHQLPFYWDDKAFPRTQKTQKHCSAGEEDAKENAQVGTKKAGFDRLLGALMAPAKLWQEIGQQTSTGAGVSKIARIRLGGGAAPPSTARQHRRTTPHHRSGQVGTGPVGSTAGRARQRDCMASLPTRGFRPSACSARRSSSSTPGWTLRLSFRFPNTPRLLDIFPDASVFCRR